MKLLLALSLLGGSLCSAQFVFFGNSRQPQQPPQQRLAGPGQRVEARPRAREGRILVEDAPQGSSSEAEFAHTFFRPDRKIIHPSKKNALTKEELKKTELVEILSEVPRTAIEEGSASEALVKQIRKDEKLEEDPIKIAIELTTSPPIMTRQDVTTKSEFTTSVTPVTEVVPVTTSALVTKAAPVTTVAPVTSAAPITTGAPVTTFAPLTTTVQTTVVVERKSPTATRVLGTPRFVQLGSGRSISKPKDQITSPAPLPAPVSAPLAQRTPKAISSASATKGNYEWEGKRYLLTWRTGRNNFDWSSGQRYCEGQGMSLISLDTEGKAAHFLALVGKERAPYFWSGGQLSRDSRSLTWTNGVIQPVRRGQHPWSFTGRTGPQPDGGETCLAILNNVYRDGVKFHDVACHHRKPVVCEQ